MFSMALTFTRRGHGARIAASLGLLGMFVLGFSPLPRLMLLPLEERFPQALDHSERVDGIIVLGGVGVSRGQVALYESGARLIASISLAQKHSNAKLIFSGGSADFLNVEGKTEADAAAVVFQLAGLSPERIVLENRSRNTRENALFTQRAVGNIAGERWLLITSAFHMPRAIACFRALALDVSPYPVDFRIKRDGYDYLRPFARFADGLRMADLAITEWAGLLAYRLAGYSNEVLPSVSAIPQ